MGTRNTGFTLAEVLITLGIIGVVAAMTLPTVMNNVRNKQLEAAFKKQYSVLTSAIALIIENEYGGSVTMDQSKYREFGSLLQKYMGSSRKIEGLTTTSNGGAQAAWMTENYKNFTGGNGSGIFNDYAFYTSDGNATIFLDLGHGDQFPELFIAIDINNVDNKPNKVGYDFFAFYLDKKGKLIPFGGDESFAPEKNYCKAGSNHGWNGLGCTRKAITDKDYFKNLSR